MATKPSKPVALASEHGTLSYLERSFASAAAALGLDLSGVERNAWGYLVFRWDAPSPDIGSLWASIAPAEVVLASRISHLHFDGGSYRTEKLSGRKLKPRIARDAAEMAARILNGEMCDTISYDAEGQPHSNGWVPKDGLVESLAYSRRIFGAEISMRAWNWFGEVSV